MDKASLHEEILEKFEREVTGLNDLRKAIEEDITECNRYRQDNPDSQFGRRLIVRTVFSSIEAFVNHIKQGCLTLDFENRANFSTIEKLALLDKSYTVRDDGNVVEQAPRITLINNICLAARSFARVANPAFTLDKSGEGFASLRRAIKIRDRMMHPRNALAYQVTDQDLKDVLASFEWFMTQINALTQVQPIAQRGQNS